MATLISKYPTLLDLANQQDYKGDVVSSIIEMLNDTNPIIQDMPVTECNGGTKHLTTIRAGIPQATFRRLYQGVQPQKGETIQVEDTIGMLEAWAEVDAKLVDLSANPRQFRLNEAMAFLEGMNQQMAKALFYGNTATDPEQFMGLAPRFNDLTAPNARQIVDGGGVGADNTSIWMVVWGPNTVHGLYPRGSKAGLSREDKGKSTKEVPDGSLYDVFREKFTWDCGISVRDWRYVSRIANIDVSALQAGQVNIYDLMTSAFWKLKQRQVMGGKAVIYCNAEVCEALDKQSRPTSPTVGGNVTPGALRVTPSDMEGKEIMSYRSIPIHETDALLNTEARVV